MWVRFWLAFSVSSATVLSQSHSNARVQQNGASFEWGWQLAPQGESPGTVGHYYVKLPQSEQRVLYAADGSGYHGAVAVNTSDQHHTHSSHFALGQKAIDLNAQPAPHQPFQPAAQADPVDIFLLQQQYPLTAIGQQPYLLPASNYPLPDYYYNNLTPLYNVQTQHPKNEASELKEASSKHLDREAKTEQVFTTPVVQVFKDHNCSDDKPQQESKELVSDIQKSKDLFADIPSYNVHNINGNFGARETNRPLTYKGAVNFRVVTPRINARNERFYYTTQVTPTEVITEENNETNEGIRKLVASTQDLISNEDLLRINHAVEQHFKEQSEDLIKPRPRFSFRSQGKDYETLDTSPTQITVRAKISNIVNSENVEHLENNQNKEQILQTISDEYRFASPIVVADTAHKNYKDQIVNNIVSTMVPYLENGYEIVGVKKTEEESENHNEYDNINVTPRPLSQNYLAPITVALRLLNDNNTFNSIDDHETSDSEIVSDTVDRPHKERTHVEVQESIPLEITHINDVEVHEYLDEGRSNKDSSFEMAKSIYNNYMEALKSKKINESINKILYNYAKNQNENTEEQNKEDYNDSKEPLEQSENYQSEVQIRPENDNNQRSELVYYDNYSNNNDYNFNGNDNQKIIQPIIIEKEVPITKYVDRYIEKQVPYPETVTVQIPVDRPVPYGYPVEKIVEKPVTKYVDKPYPVEVPRPYPVQVKVPYPVEQKVYVDRPVHVPYPVEKVVEKQVIQQIPVPTPVAVPVQVQVPVEHQVLYPFAVDRPVPVAVEVEKQVETIKEVPVPYPVEKRVPYPVHYETKVPVPYAVEKRVPYPVEKIVEKPVTVTQVVDRPIHIDRPVPVPIHVHHPYPVNRIVEKKVPYPVHIDRIVEKKVPYPVEKIVEKIVEKPVVVTKYINKPYPVEKRVPYPVEKIVEKPYAVRVPFEVKVPYPVETIVEKKVHIPVFLRYHYSQQYNGDESRNNLQYQLPDQKQYLQDQKEKVAQNTNHISHSQYTQIIKELMQKNAPKIQSTRWGNQYASSYQYINTPDVRQVKLQPSHPYKYENPRQEYQNNYENQSHEEKTEPNQNYNYESKNHEEKSESNQNYNYENQRHEEKTEPNQNYNYENQWHEEKTEPNQNHNYENLRHEQKNGHQNYNYESHRQEKNRPQQNNIYDNRGQEPQNYYKKQNQYYGPAPIPHERDQWGQNPVEYKQRRTDRVPKMTKVNIEYGFKPPLIPSTEIDLDGLPVKKSE